MSKPPRHRGMSHRQASFLLSRTSSGLSPCGSGGTDDLPEALDWLCKSLAASSLCERCNLDLEVLEELVACSSAVGRGELGLERANPCVRALSAGRSLPSARGDHQAQRQSDIPYPTTKQA